MSKPKNFRPVKEVEHNQETQMRDQAENSNEALKQRIEQLILLLDASGKQDEHVQDLRELIARYDHSLHCASFPNLYYQVDVEDFVNGHAAHLVPGRDGSQVKRERDELRAANAGLQAANVALVATAQLATMPRKKKATMPRKKKATMPRKKKAVAKSKKKR